MKISRKCLSSLLFFIAALYCASTVAQLPNVPWKAAQELTKNQRNTLTYNDEGFVTGVVIKDFPSGFMMGQLEVFSELESVAIDSRYYFEDSRMGGIRKLKNLKKFVLKRSRYATGTCLELLAEAPLLESLELRDCNEITRLHELSRIRRLKHLTLVADDVLSLTPLRECRNLESVKLGNNSSIDDSSMKVLGQVRTLKSIDLSKTAVTDEGLAELAKLPNLEELKLEDCENITGEGFEEFASPHGLKELNLRGVRKLNDAGLAELAKFEDLENLLLYQNVAVKRDGFRCLNSMKKLKLLSCPETNIRDEHLQAMDGIRSLKAIWLPECPNISGRGIDFLTQSQGVVRIKLNKCRKIDSPDLEVLAKFKNLEELYIANTRIRNNGIAKLCELKKLQTLDVSGNHWLEDAAFEKLQNSSMSKLTATGLPKLTNAAFLFASKMKKLNSLSLTAHKGMNGDGLKAFVDNPRLKSLGIDAPQHLSLEACGFIRQIPNVEELYLRKGELAIAQLEQLSGMQKLRILKYEVVSGSEKSEQLIAVLSTFPNLE